MTGRPRTRTLELLGGFRLDRVAQELRHHGAAVALRRRTWQVLRYLAERPGVLVTKRELHDAVWGGIAVTEDTLTQSILELRRTFGDDARKPRFIETVHARGFRFIAAASDRARPAPRVARGAVRAAPFVGRAVETGHLRACLRRAVRGQRQIVFVTGEAGIGKTRLLDEFLRSAAVRRTGPLVLTGRCIERHAGREAYAPVLEALERTLSSADGRTLLAAFGRLGPTWIAQMPALMAQGHRPSRAVAVGVGPSLRMLREGTAALEAMAAERTVVLVLEDLHWSDPATIDLVSALGQRSDPARLLVVASYRPAEASVADHPIRLVRQTLRARDRSVDVALGYLSEGSVREYLRSRLGDAARRLAAPIHAHTDGNPLFVVGAVDELIRRGTITKTRRGWAVPVTIGPGDLALSDDVRDMIALELRHLTPDERQIVETGAVAGVTFASEIVASALGRDPDDVAAACDRLARAGLLLEATDDTRWLGRASLAQHRFIHGLHHHVVYGQVPAARRRRLHAGLGNALEAAAGVQAEGIAPDLARHFERGGDVRRAFTYLLASGMRALRRYAGAEAASYLHEALSVLAKEPDGDGRARREIEVRSLLSLALSTTAGYLSAAVIANHERVIALRHAAPDARRVFESVFGLFLVVLHRADRDAAPRVVADLERMAADLDATDLQPRVTLARALCELFAGRLASAEEAFARLAALGLDRPTRDFGSIYGVDPTTFGLAHRGVGDWLRGYPDRARAWVRAGIAHAERSENPVALGAALCHGVYVTALRGNAGEAAELSLRATALAADRDLAYYQPVVPFMRGVALAEGGLLVEALPLMEEGVAGRQAVGNRIAGSLLLAYLVDVHVRAGLWDEGLARVDAGLAVDDGCFDASHVADLWRLRGELVLGRAAATRGRRRWGASAEVAEDCFRRGLELAEAQGARMLALRNATSLFRLCVAQKRGAEARSVLAPLYETFDEGFDTKDLLEARRVLGGSDIARPLAS